MVDSVQSVRSTNLRYDRAVILFCKGIPLQLHWHSLVFEWRCLRKSLPTKGIRKRYFSDKFFWMNQIKTKPKCILCDRSAVSRGLCKSHYEIFRKSKQLAKDPAEFERIAIERKLISADDKRRASNPFEDLRLEIDSEIEPKKIAAEVRESYTKSSRETKPES